MMNYVKVNPHVFETFLVKVDEKFLSKNRDYTKKTCYVDELGNSGFALTEDGALCHVFSLKPGFGVYAVEEALRLGANRLSCFQGYLPKYYQNFGFETVIKETYSDKPDKYWMVYKRPAKGVTGCRI